MDGTDSSVISSNDNCSRNILAVRKVMTCPDKPSNTKKDRISYRGINEVNDRGDDDKADRSIMKIPYKGVDPDKIPTHIEDIDKIHPALEEEFGLYQVLNIPRAAGQKLKKKHLLMMQPPNRTIILNYGPIPGRPPTIFFSYPLFLNI